jgi:hypothetical protein
MKGADQFGPCPVCAADWEEFGPCGTCDLWFTDCSGGGPAPDGVSDLPEHEVVSWSYPGIPVAYGQWTCPRCGA